MRLTPLFTGTLVVLAVIAVAGFYFVARKPSVGVDATVRAFFEAARKNDTALVREYCTPDLAPHAVREWMLKDFTYTLGDVEDETASNAEVEAEIKMGPGASVNPAHFYLRFGLYNADNRWRINLMMVMH